MGDILSDAKKIIDDNAKVFCDKIYNYSDIGPFKRKSPVSFEIFHPANDEYFEYKNLEKTLEWYIRDWYVNSTIDDLFKLHDKEVWWPNTDKHYAWFTNESIEDVLHFEFISDVEGKSVLYRYTDPCLEDEELDAFLEDFEVDHIEVIDWSDTDSLTNNKVSWGVSLEKRNKVIQITLHKFFLDHFTEEEYKYFVEKGQEAVRTANNDIGFQTIPKLSLRNLSGFKHDILKWLESIDYTKLRYEIIETAHSDNDSRNRARRKANRVLDSADYSIVTENFVKKKLYSALVGKEEYAKCFVTSEYMFQIFNGGGGFEYTTIVCGYLKSIEQLAKKLLDITLKNFPEKELWIKKNNNRGQLDRSDTRSNPVTNKPQVRVKESNKEFFDVTLAPLMWFLHDNSDGWNVSDNAVRTIHGYFENYTSECRNEHFHKDNIYDWEAVKKIRNNTLLLMYLLIGGYTISDDEGSIKRDIGAIDTSFDSLYRRLKEIPRSVNRYYMEFPDGRREKVIRLYDQEKAEYSEGGFLDTAHIDFVRVEDFHFDDYEAFLNSIKDEDRIIVNNKNVPSRMWFEKYGGEEVEIFW
ncbi:MAG: hypothetical protein IJJ64_08110 [Butyrivibrio sp.]|nr:hypothetical protein [Butyrivibrio sp.]